jgi:hypothetical protein
LAATLFCSRRGAAHSFRRSAQLHAGVTIQKAQ